MITQATKEDILKLLDALQDNSEDINEIYSGKTYLGLPEDSFLGFPEWHLKYMDSLFKGVLDEFPEKGNELAREFIVNLPLDIDFDVMLTSIYEDHLRYFMAISMSTRSRLSTDTNMCLLRCLDSEKLDKLQFVNDTEDAIRETEERIKVLQDGYNEEYEEEFLGLSKDDDNFDQNVIQVNDLLELRTGMNNILVESLHAAKKILKFNTLQLPANPEELLMPAFFAAVPLRTHYGLISYDHYFLEKAAILVDIHKSLHYAVKPIMH